MPNENPLFRTTPVVVSGSDLRIKRNETMLWMGSCFVESMATFLQQFRYKAEINPLGVVFHPLVLEKLLGLSTEDFRPFHFEKSGVWLNYLLGNPFVAQSPEQLDELIAEAAAKTRTALASADWLVMTWGTAYWYSHTALGMVGKCHKQPNLLFEKKRSSPEEISAVWIRKTEQLRAINPGLKVLITLSPVRHTRDGLPENALSKACLRLAIEQVVLATNQVCYFPAFEMVMDELRDYRFFEPDLVHPNKEAISYLWKRFSDQFLEPGQVKTNQAMLDLHQLKNHRPVASFGNEFQAWKSAIARKTTEVEAQLARESTWEDSIS